MSFYRVLAVFLVATSISISAQRLCAQEEADPIANRTLSGNSDFGDLGRHIGGTVSLGTLSVSSDDLEALVFPGVMDPDPVAAHAINVPAGGYALLPNNFLIRNESGGDLSFDGSNQTHDFAVYHLGSGDFDQSFSLSGANQYTNGSGETVTAYGGNVFWEAQFNRLDGQEQTFAISDQRFQTNSFRFSPLTLGLSRNPSETSSQYNLTTSPELIRSSLQRLSGEQLVWSLSENQTATIERQNTLFDVAGVSEVEDQPTLDLSGISISAAGTSLRNRRIGSFNNFAVDGITPSATISQRFISGLQPDSFSVNDSVSVVTRFENDVRTDLTLSAFSETSDDGNLSVSLDDDVQFNSAANVATVNVSGTFSLDPATTGTVSHTLNVGSSIVGEGVTGETKQSSLDIGVQVGVVENNSIVANDITVFKLEGVDSSGERSINETAGREFSTLTHTAISVSKLATLNNSSQQTVVLSQGNGVFGEGLAGETVGTASYDIHQVTVEGSELSIAESGLVSDSPIVFENKRAFDGSKLQAQSIVTDVVESGSSRWTLSGLDGWDFDLDAGESLTLNPIFDDEGISPNETLGRNFRKSVTFEFQDGLRDIQGHLVDGTVAGSVSGEERFGSFDILGSRDTQQEATYLLEQSNFLVGDSGSAFLAAGSTLQSEGINLTNTGDNTSEQAGVQTELRIIDSEVLSGSVELEAAFSSLDNIDANAEFAGSDTSGFFSDILEVSGLDGVLHVLELSYDPARGAADLLWFNEEEDIWMNAVLGNSNIEPGIELSLGDSINQGVIFIDGEAQDLLGYLTELRFEGSYDDYLLSLGDGFGPELGAFGSSNGRAWAVVDHNSAFATARTFAVPEPSATFLLAALSTGLLVRRRR
jgi:hypothetical protein